jgi:hypothetical protein
MILTAIFSRSQTLPLFLWEYVKNSVYRSSAHAVEPKEGISSVIRITAHSVNGVVADFQLQIILGCPWFTFSVDRLFSQVYGANR